MKKKVKKILKIVLIVIAVIAALLAAAAILGKAIYSGKLDLERAVKLAE